jgi:8-oxo-dGTP diphosphatase
MSYSFSRAELADVCARFATFDPPGVLILDSGKPGPVLGILAHTHGNEPAGLAAFADLLRDQRLACRLQCGQVRLVLNNLEAARRYYAEAEGQAVTAPWRFVDQDMNRVPQTLAGGTYELTRLRTLAPFYHDLTHVLDLHSTSAPSPAMLITARDTSPVAFPGVAVHLDGIVDCLSGRPLVALAPDAQAYVLECGAHEHPASWQLAQQAVWFLLARLGLIAASDICLDTTLTSYQVYRAVIFPNDSYRLPRLLSSFEFLPAGTLLAEGDGEPLVIDRDSIVIMPPPRLQPVHPGSEFLFLATGPALPVTEVSCALLCHQGRVLAARRSERMAHTGLWEFPGGKREPQESAAACLHREMREELGVEITLHQQLPAVEYTYPQARIRLLPYICSWQSGELRAREHAELRWCTPAELQTLTWLPADQPILAALLASDWL